jgi:hypothetical protein
MLIWYIRNYRVVSIFERLAEEPFHEGPLRCFARPELSTFLEELTNKEERRLSLMMTFYLSGAKSEVQAASRWVRMASFLDE